MWKTKDDAYQTGAIEVFEFNGIPVIVSHAGKYPVAVHEDGRNTKSGEGYTPHIEISISSLSQGKAVYYTGVTVTANGNRQPDGTYRSLPILSEQNHDGFRQDKTPEAFISLGKSHLDHAVETLKNIDAIYEKAEATEAKAYKYSGPLSRTEYESACDACGVDALSDEDCDSYGVQYGDYRFPEYSAEHVAKMYLAFLRMRRLKEKATSENKRPAPVQAIEPQGQLWEPCENCGNEPVQMPLHLCADCWPK